jgi:hypothetical protein
MGVHPEPGRGVDLDDAAAGLAHGLGDVGADEVDAGDVEADDRCGGLRDLDVVGVASKVRSIDVPPVLMLPVSASLTKAPFGGTESAV